MHGNALASQRERVAVSVESREQLPPGVGLRNRQRHRHAHFFQRCHWFGSACHDWHALERGDKRIPCADRFRNARKCARADPSQENDDLKSAGK